MNFEKDIFISYAHIDDQPLIEGERGWVSEFHRSLEIRLAQLLGYKPRIWRDIALDGNHMFNDEILAQLPNIAIMVSVISPRYVKSEWCVREVTEFINASQKNIGLTVQNRSRIFKAIKTPVSLEQHPAPIQGLLGYEFFRIDPERKKVNEFSHVYGAEARSAYWARLDDIAHDIATILEEMKTRGESIVAPAESKGKVYLAETAQDLRESRETVKRELIAHGYEVLPDRNLPLVAGEYSAAAIGMMRECKLLVHMIGGKYGVVPEETEKSLIHLQAESGAAAAAEKNIPRLIWLQASGEIGDKRQEDLVHLLRTDEQLSAGSDIIETLLDDLKFAIHEKLKAQEKREAKTPPAAANASGPKRIYLICDREDLEDVRSLEDHLFHQGFDVLLPIFEGDQSQLREEHQESLRTCDAALVYFGRGSELWLRSMMRDLLKAPGYGRSSPLDKKAVYVAGPSSPQKERFRTHEAAVISGLQDSGLNVKALDEFTSKLK